jgi:hypothetical protein
MPMKAILIDKASEKLRNAIAEAKLEISESADPETKALRASELVLKKILAGQEGLHDPENSGDMLILTMASWD